MKSQNNRYLQGFSSFTEAREKQNIEAYQRGFDAKRTAHFLEQTHRQKPSTFKPGLYCFATFQDAQAFELKNLIQHAVK